MTAFEQDLLDRIMEVKDAISDLKREIGQIQVKLDSDFHALYGNGKPGLLDDHTKLDKRVHTLEILNGVKAKVVVGICWIITTAIAIWGVIKSSSK